ncbi:hypothetical protein VTJ83DRAFT_1936 [Remersonia thermophila]|uniref:Uncharacterized protein n=1 Tax=Remersonia thermophila TaxID=72144 RepID=A0ABR4DHB5_9PEZI
MEATTTTATAAAQPTVEAPETHPDQEDANDSLRHSSNSTSTHDSTPTRPSGLPAHHDMLLLEALSAALVGIRPSTMTCDASSAATTSPEPDDYVPVYSETDPFPAFPQELTSGDATPYAALLTVLDANPTLRSLLCLPLTSSPPSLLPCWSQTLRRTVPSQHPLAGRADLPDEHKRCIYRAQSRIVDAFFAAIQAGDVEAVARFVRDGLVSPDVAEGCRLPDETEPHGRTPLIAAVQTGRGDVVCALVALGAGVDVFGTVPAPGSDRLRGRRSRHHDASVRRTPLMVAATENRLAMVKLLMEGFGADDALIAPDGQLALRLAVEHKRADIVRYLPARRGGAWRRWCAEHAAAMRRARWAAGKIGFFFKFFLWYVPKFLVWNVPKDGIVVPLWKGLKYGWENKHKLGGWCKRQIKALPGRLARGGKAVWRGVGKIPKIVKATARWAWGCIRRIAKAAKVLVLWLWNSLKTIGGAVKHALLRVLAAIHTAVAAALDFFRSITLRDVWRGVKDAVEALVRGLPRAIWVAASGLGIAVAAVIVTLFGMVGQMILFVLQVLLLIVQYVPKQLGVILGAFWTSVVSGYHEIMLWFDPKRL